MTAFTSFAPAKINLSLHVGPPRSDGRHPLESIAAFADVGDMVTASQAEGLSLSLTGPFAAELHSEKDNLVLRAARALARQAGISAPGAELALEKHLPIASGVGGGSSDAAAALRALNALWRLGASFEDLETLARELGADVPVCVRATPAFMTGAGEISAPIDLADLFAVLVNPLTPLATHDCYRMFDAMGLGAGFESAQPPCCIDRGAAMQNLSSMRNDLTAPALRLSPSVGDVLHALERAGASIVRMSGSGATCFGLFKTSQAAAVAAADLARTQPNWWIMPARLGAVDVGACAL